MNNQIKGKTIDNQTRCSHYYSELDIIAIKFRCCNTYYPCYSCHDEDSTHKPEIWQKEEFNNMAILCGVCEQEMTINQYLACDSSCPFCQAAFNPKCSNHHHLYFEANS
jgi:uncharacterized CHY-type Zn-finger protein